MLFRRRDPAARKVHELQQDFAQAFSTPAGRRVFAHLALMWGHYGGNAEGMRPEFHDAFLWILEVMGINHLENVQQLSDNLRGVQPFMPRQERLEPEPILDDEDDEDIGNWRRTGA